MSAVRTVVLVVAACLPTGCAYVYWGPTQTGCEQGTQTYAEMASCLKTAITNTHTSRELGDPDVKVYFQKVEQTAELVGKNVISDFDGRVELRDLYMNLQRREAAK